MTLLLVCPSPLIAVTIALLVCGVDCADLLARKREILQAMGTEEEITEASGANSLAGVDEKLTSIWTAVSETRELVAELSRDHFAEFDRIKQTLSEVQLLHLNLARALENVDATPSVLPHTSLPDEATDVSESVLASSSPPTTETGTEPTAVAQPPPEQNLSTSCNGISCPVLFFALGSQCFYINTRDELTWDAARDWCRNRGGDLADPLDPKPLIDKMIELSPEGKYWLGATDREHEGKWLGVSGRLVNMSPKLWEKDEPNNYNGVENCLEVGFYEDVFNDIHCDAEMKFVCEHPPI